MCRSQPYLVWDCKAFLFRRAQYGMVCMGVRYVYVAGVGVGVGVGMCMGDEGGAGVGMCRRRRWVSGWVCVFEFFWMDASV